MKTNPSLQQQFAALTRQETTTFEQDNHDMGSQGLANFILKNKGAIRFVEDTLDQGTPGIGTSEGRLTAEEILMKYTGWWNWPRGVLIAMREYAAQFEQKWQSMETAPKDGTTILAFAELGYQVIVYWRKGDNQWAKNPHDPGWLTLTHWRHLPTPPIRY